MAIKIEDARSICNEISLEVKDTYKMLSLNFIIHHKGQRVEAAEIALQEMHYHPALKNAIKILKTMPKLESSTYLGTAIGKERIFGGLASREVFVALFTVNIDQYIDKKDLKAQIYHFVWHALVSLMNYFNQNIKNQSKMGMLPETSIYVKAHNNLMADSFSSIISALNGDIVTIKKIAFTRALNAISARTAIRPEEQPFLLAYETTIYAINQTLDLKIPKKKQIATALKLSQNIGSIINHAEIKIWIDFCKLSQDMAWRGYSKEVILGSSIYIAQNTHHRAIGHFVSEISRTEPSPILNILDKYSSFGAKDYNEQIHEKELYTLKNTILQDAISTGNTDLLIEKADEQNLLFSKGRVCGWSAYAFQRSSQILKDCILENKKHNEIKMLVEDTFNKFSKVISWEDLNQISKDIIKHRREGEEFSLGSICELISNREDLLSLKGSLKLTIQNQSSAKQSSYAIKDTPHQEVNLNINDQELLIDKNNSKIKGIKNLISKIRNQDEDNNTLPE